MGRPPARIAHTGSPEDAVDDITIRHTWLALPPAEAVALWPPILLPRSRPHYCGVATGWLPEFTENGRVLHREDIAAQAKKIGEDDIGLIAGENPGPLDDNIAPSMPALTHPAQSYAAGWVARKFGTIVDVASIAATCAIVNKAVCAAAKACVFSFKGALWG